MCKSFFTFMLFCALSFGAPGQSRAQSAAHAPAEAHSPAHALAQAQSAEAAVREAVDRLFDGMRAGDSTAVRAVLHPEARFMTALIRDRKPLLHVGSVERFVQAVGTPHDRVWDERIWDVDVHVDEQLATAWMGYAFYLGDEFSHCGVNAFQLFHDGSGWKIFQITDTRRSEGCEIPEK